MIGLHLNSLQESQIIEEVNTHKKSAHNKGLQGCGIESQQMKILFGVIVQQESIEIA